MGVYIKSMEMPKDCPYCPLAHWNFKNEFTGCEIVKKYFSTEEMYADGKPDFCPLVPVPPHGRLIDADALMLKILDYIEEYSDVDEKGWHNLKWCAMKEAEMAIKDAPTIIPAEEGE